MGAFIPGRSSSIGSLIADKVIGPFVLERAL
jgi:hypothetical protein